MTRKLTVPSYIDISTKSYHTFYKNQQDADNKENPLSFNVARLFDNQALNSLNFTEFTYWQGKGNILLGIEDGLGICIGEKIIRLQDSIEQKLVQYLSDPMPSLDCYEFVQHLIPHLEEVLDQPSQQYYSTKKYPTGSVSQVVNKSGEALHTQLYLGEGIFMGKMGEQGVIMFSDAQTQEEYWDGEKTVIYPIMKYSREEQVIYHPWMQKIMEVIRRILS